MPVEALARDLQNTPVSLFLQSQAPWLWPLSETNEEFEIRIGPKSDTGATDNPVFVAMVKLFAYTFLQGAVGEASTNPVTFRLTQAPTLNTT